MNMVVLNGGKTRYLDLLTGADGGASEDMVVRLFKNNFTPVDGSVAGSFTEADFTGYSPVTIAYGSFDPATIVANVAEAEFAAAPTYNCSGGSPQTVYGWYMTGDSSGIAYLAQRFDAPRVMVPGAEESLDPFKLKLKSFA